MPAAPTIDELHKALARPGAGSAPPAAPPATAPPVARGRPSISDLQKALGAPQQQAPLYQRALEALPGGKGVERYFGRQEEKLKEIGKQFQTEKEDLFGKDGHKGAVQRVIGAYKADPYIQNQLDKWNTPLLNVDVTGFGAPKLNEGGTPEEYKDYLRERTRRDAKLQQDETRIQSLYRGAMEGVGDMVSGLTSPTQLALIFGTEGLGLEAKIAAKGAKGAAEAEAGLSAVARGAGQWEAEKAAGQAGLAASRNAAEEFSLQQPLAQFSANRAMSALMSLGFTAQMGMGAWSDFKQAQAQFRAGDITGGTRSFTSGIIGGLFGATSALHAGHSGVEAYGRWKSEGEVRAALETGSQDTFKKPWKDLTQDEKSRVVSQSVMKYGSEDAKQFQRQMTALGMRPGYADVLQTLDDESHNRFGKGWYELDQDQRAHMVLDAENLWPEIDRNTPEGRMKANQIMQIMEASGQEGLNEENLAKFRAQREARDAQIAGIQEPARGRQFYRDPRDVAYERVLEEEYGKWRESAAAPDAELFEPSGEFLDDEYFYRKYGIEPDWKPKPGAPEYAVPEERFDQAGNPLPRGERLIKPKGYAERRAAYDAYLAEEERRKREQAAQERAQGFVEENRKQSEAEKREADRMAQADQAYERDEAAYQQWEARRRMLEAKVRAGKRLSKDDQGFLLRKPLRPPKPYGYDERKKAGTEGLSDQGTRGTAPAAAEKPAEAPPLTGIDKELYDWASKLSIRAVDETPDNFIERVYSTLSRRLEEGENLNGDERGFLYMYKNRAALEELQNWTPPPVERRVETREEKEEAAQRDLELEIGRQQRERDYPQVSGRARIDSDLRGEIEAEIGKAVETPSDAMAEYQHTNLVLEKLAETLEMPEPEPGRLYQEAEQKPLDKVAEAYHRLRQKQANGDALNDGERMFLGMWEKRKALEKRLAEESPAIKAALDKAQESHAEQSARELTDAVQSARRMGEVARTLAQREVGTDPEAVKQKTDQVIQAREFAESYQRKADAARAELGVEPEFRAPDLREQLGLTPETATIAPHVYDRLADQMAETGKTLEQLLGTNYGPELARELLGERASQYLDSNGMLTDDGRSVLRRLLVENALGERVDGIPDAVLERVMPHLGALARLTEGDPAWRIGGYMADALRDLADMELQMPALLRIGKDTDSLLDRYYRPLNFAGGDRIDPTPRPAPNRITEALAKTLLNGDDDPLLGYAAAESMSMATGETQVDAFNRHVADKVQMKVDILDFEQTEPVTPAERAQEEKSRERVEPTPAEAAAEANPTALPAEARQQQAEAQVIQGAIDGDVTPESIRELFASHENLRGFADELTHIFSVVMPGSTGVTAADLLRRSGLSDVQLVDEIKDAKGNLKKGVLILLADGRKIIQLSKIADLSTFIHEMAHLIRPWVKAEDMLKIEKYIKQAMDKESNYLDLGVWDDDKEEMFARMLELYYSTGKLPDADNQTKNAFSKIKAAMRGIYFVLKGGKEELPQDSKIRLVPSTTGTGKTKYALIKKNASALQPEIEAIFDAWHRADEARKSGEAPPTPQGPPEPIAAAPQAVQSAPVAAETPKPTPTAAKAPDTVKEALARQQEAWKAFDAVTGEMERKGLMEKSPQKMTPEEKEIYNRYLAAEKEAELADNRVRKLPIAEPPVETAKQELTPPPATAISGLTAEHMKAIEKHIANRDLPAKQKKKLTPKESVALDDALTNHWDELPLEYFRPEARTEVSYYRQNPGAQNAMLGLDGLDAALGAMRKMSAALGKDYFPMTKNFTEPQIDEFVKKLTDAEAKAWAEKGHGFGDLFGEGGPEGESDRAKLARWFKESRRRVAAFAAAGRQDGVDFGNLAPAMVQAMELIEEHAGPVAAYPEDLQLAAPPEKVIEGQMAPPPEKVIEGQMAPPPEAEGPARHELTDWVAEAARGKAAPMNDIHGKPTGWLRVDDQDGTMLLHPTENWGLNFEAEDKKSGTDALRAKAKAQAYAIDHPVEPAAKAPRDLVPKPLNLVMHPLLTGEPRPGKVGDMLADGEVVLTATGRKTTPFPKLGFGSERKTQNTVRRVDQWLMDNAVEEAKARGDEFNLRQFEANRKKPSPADKDSAEMYLFDKDSVQPIPKPLLKSLATPPTQEAKQTLALPPEPYGPALELTPFEGYSAKTLWERERAAITEAAKNKSDLEDRNFDAFLYAMKLLGVAGKDDEGTLTAFYDTVKAANTWEELAAGIREPLQNIIITNEDDGYAMARLAKQFLEGKPLRDALENIADQMRDPEAARKELFSLEPPPEESGTLEATDGRPENQPEGTAGGAQDLPGVREPASEGGNAPAPVSAKGDQAAQGGGDARPGAGRADDERVEHPGGLPEERLPDGRGPGGSVPPDLASQREGRGADAAGRDAGEPERVGADGKPVDTPTPKKPKAAQVKIAELRNKHNYHISDEYAATIGSGGEITKIKGNLDALELLKKLQAEGREVATPEEQAILAKYVDFGGLVGMLQNRDKPEYADHYARFEKLLTPEEIQEIRETLPNTHYTSLKMVDWMWQAMQKMGFKGGRILEPGMGIGNFWGRMPRDISGKSELYGVERNPLTGAMARLLYPDARIMVKPFQQVTVPDNSLDTIIGNVPFQDFAVTDDPRYRKLKLNLHNYFIVKSLDMLRPGGIAALITSRYTMDNGTGLGVRAREEMARRADLIAAFRLPDKAFKGNAGTEVVADLLIFRKRSPSDIPEGAPDWTKLAKITVKGDAPVEEYGRYGKYITNRDATFDKEFNISKYFVDHPENVLGTHSKEGKMYGPGQYTVKAPEDFEAALKEALNRVPAKAFGKVKESEANRPPSTLDPGELNFAPEDVKPGSFYRDKDGTILMKESGVGKKLPMELNSPAARQHIGDAIDLRDTLNQLIQTQLTTSDDEPLKEQQKALDSLYEKYRKKYGSLNGPALRKVFGEDPEYPKLLALENIDPETKTVSKADIFSKRVLAPYEPLRDLPEDPKSAMLKVIAEKGHLDTGLMAELLKKPEEEVIENLSKEGLIYRDPRSGDYSTADEYLSGHVREKLRLARQAADVDPKFKANVEALEKVQPQDVSIHEIQPSLGQTWIPNEVYVGFLQHLAGGLHRSNISITRDPSGRWLVQVDKAPLALTNKWGTSRVAGHKLVQYAMNQQLPTVWDTDSDGKRHLNQEATVGAREKLAAIKEEFNTVLRRANQATIDNLENIYNETFGGYRQREFSGEHLTFPGMSEDWRGMIRGYQKASVWRILQEGRGGIFHAPGLGKTLTMAAAGMEAKRLKLSRKNMYAVPNHMVPQWRQDFKKFYPNAHVLAVTDEDFTPENRNRLMSRIATGDWDVVIVPHSQFDTLPMSPVWEKQTINKRLDEYRAVLQELDEKDKDDEKTIKQIEKLMDKLESRLNDLNAKKKDNTIHFDELGVDMLFVDEAHLYKSMAVPTKMSGIGGVASSASQRAFALEMKGDYLRQTHSGRGLVFGTGTPITNTLGELYIMNKYLAPELLEEAGIRGFDDWVANFADTVTQYEYSADGVTFKPKTTLSEFKNVPELQTMFRRFGEYLSKEAAKALSNLKEPEVKRNDVMVKITPVQEPLLQMIAERGKRLTDHPPRTREEKQADNWLKLSSDARKISLDPRLYSPRQKDHPGSKANRAVDIIKTTLDETKAKKGTVVVFSDFFQHVDSAGKPDFNLFEDMKKKLAKKGIPADQIAIIHEAKNKEAKEALFAKVRNGKVRVLFGSTDKMGIGTNIQNLLKAELHLDQPWRPDQVEQREGRIERSGNQWDQVDIHRFIAEPEQGTVKVWVVDGYTLGVDGKSEETGHWEERERPRAYDLQMYQQLARKANFQEQFLSGNYRGRRMEDVGGDVKLNSQMFALGKAMATGNPDAMRKLKVENDLRTFELLERNYQIERSRNARNLDSKNFLIADLKRKLAKTRQIMEVFHKNAKLTEKDGWHFNVQIGDKLYGNDDIEGLLATTSLDDLVGKQFKIAGLPTQVSLGDESFPLGAGIWETRPTFTFLDAKGELRKVNRMKGGEQTLKTLLGMFLNHANNLDAEHYVREIASNEKFRDELVAEVAKPSPYIEKIEAMEQEVREIDQRLGVAHPAPQQDEIPVEDEDEDKPSKGDDTRLYQEAPEPNLSGLTPEQENSELVAEDGDLQGHMAEARAKQFGSVEEAKDWLIDAAQGDQYDQTFHGTQVRRMPDGGALALYAPKNRDLGTQGPKDLNRLYQEAPDSPEAMDRLRQLRDAAEYRVRLSPFMDDYTRKKNEEFIVYANKKLGDRGQAMTPPPESQGLGTKGPGTGKVESYFPAEVKDAGTYTRRATQDDSRRLPDAGGVRGLAPNADRPGGAGETGRAGLGRGTDGGGRGVPQREAGLRGAGSGRELSQPLPYIKVREPRRARGKELVTPVQWKAQTLRLGIPSETPPPTVTLRPEIAEKLGGKNGEYKGQLEQAETLASGLEQFDGVISAAPTGGGKTYINMAIAKQLWTPEARQIIVSKNRPILAQRSGWKDVGKKAFKMDLEYLPNRKVLKAGPLEPGTYMTTYTELMNKPELLAMPWDLVIFDEAAEARGWYRGGDAKWNQGKAARKLSDVAKKAVYVSAAPYHSAVELGWMTKLDLWNPGQFEEWAKQLGARKGKNKWKLGKLDPEQTWLKHGSDPRYLMALRDLLVKRGQFATQTMNMDGHSTDIALVASSEHQRLQLANIEKAFQLAEKYYKDKKQPQRAVRARALGAIYKKNYLERMKLPQLIELAKQGQKQGWQVAVFAEHKTGQKLLWNYLQAPNIASMKGEGDVGEIRRLLPELPDVYEELAKALGRDNVANYSGTASALRARTGESFREGEKPFLFSTYAAGGVGVSFHDDSEGGLRPKMVIHLGLPWSGMMFNQANGRFWRYGTKSNVHSVFLVGDTYPEVDLILNKVMPRLNSIHAAVRGLDGQDPLVKGMRKLTREETYNYDLGYKAKYDLGDYKPMQGQIPIRDWTHAKAHLPNGEEAKGKGMKYPEQSTKPGIQNRLFQEEQGTAGLRDEGTETEPGTGLPPRFLSPEEAQAYVDAAEMQEAFERGEPVPGIGEEVEDIDPGDRQIAAEQTLPAVKEKIAQRGQADAKATARQATTTAMNNIYAAKQLRDIDVIADAEAGDPQWKMKGEAPPKPDPKLKSERFRWWNVFFSGMENIRSMTKAAGVPEVGHEIDLKNRNFHAWKNQYAGELMAKWFDIKKANNLSKTEVRDAWLVKEGKKTSNNPRVLRAVQQLTGLMNEIRRMAADKGINLNDYDTDGQRLQIPYSEIADNPNYMPHIFDYHEKIRLTDPRTGEEQVFTLKQLLGENTLADIKKDRIISAIAADRGISRQEVENWIENKKRKTPLAANMERARTADLPFYRMDEGALLKYFAGVGEVFARTEQFGQDMEKLDALIKQIPDARYRKNVKNIMTDSLAPAPWSEGASRFYSFMTTAAVISKMTFSPIKVPYHLIHTGLVLEQFRPMLKALVQAPFNFAEMRQRGIFSGALADGVNAQVNMELASKMRLSHEVLKRTGFNWLYQFDRIVAAQTSRNWMEDYALPQLIRKAKRSAHIREQLGESLLLTDKQIDDAIQRGRWTEDDFKHAAAAFTNRVMFTSDPTEMPYVSRMRAPEYPMIDNFAIAVRVAFALKSFMFKTSMLLKRSVFDEAKKGNFKPMILFMLAYPAAGAALRLTSGAVKAAVGQPGSLNKQEQDWNEIFDDPSIAKLAHEWVDDTANASALTMFSHILDVTMFPPKEKRKKQYQREQLPWDVAKEELGPYGDVAEIFKTLLKMAESGRDDLEDGDLDKLYRDEAKPALDTGGEVLPALRPGVPWLEDQLGVGKKKRFEMAPPP